MIDISLTTRPRSKVNEKAKNGIWVSNHKSFITLRIDNFLDKNSYFNKSEEEV